MWKNDGGVLSKKGIAERNVERKGRFKDLRGMKCGCRKEKEENWQGNVRMR